MGNGSFIIFIVLLINFAISYWNARVVGTVWIETKEMGGIARFMAWMGAIQSASGFSWCYLFILLVGAQYAEPFFRNANQPQILTNEAIRAGFSLGYIVLIPGILFSGLAIWIQSLVQAWRERDLPSMGAAAWNTFAQIHNMASAMRGMPEAFGSVKDFFGGESDSDDDSDGAKGKAIILVLILVIVAIIGGVMTTWAIINQYAGSKPMGPKPDFQRQR